jgi:hypothetical protein
MIEKKKKPAVKEKPLTAVDKQTLFALMDQWWEGKVVPIRKTMTAKKYHCKTLPIVRVPIDQFARVLFHTEDVVGRDHAVDWLCSPLLGWEEEFLSMYSKHTERNRFLIFSAGSSTECTVDGYLHTLDSKQSIDVAANHDGFDEIEALKGGPEHSV